MPDASEQVEQVLRPIGHRRAGQQKYKLRADYWSSRVGLHAEQLQAMRRALTRVFDEVGLIENDSGPIDAVQAVSVFADDVVVDDHPARVLCDHAINADDLDGGIRVDHQDLALLVQF